MLLQSHLYRWRVVHKSAKLLPLTWVSLYPMLVSTVEALYFAQGYRTKYHKAAA